MGGIHKYDLTPNVTHLIVGEYDTPKYRHVAKERPDIVPMTTGWIYEAREMWMADQEFNFAALEAKWRLKTFESGGGDPESSEPASRENKRLLCCLTGFEDRMSPHVNPICGPMRTRSGCSLIGTQMTCAA